MTNAADTKARRVQRMRGYGGEGGFMDLNMRALRRRDCQLGGGCWVVVGGCLVGGLETLEFSLGFGEGALQAALALGETVEQNGLVRRGGVSIESIRLGGFHANQFPLRDGHLPQVELFRVGLWPPFGFQGVAKLGELLAIFTG